MSKDKEVKTNAMRILDRNKVKYKVNTYECDEFIDGIHIADMLGQPYESSFKTLVTVGKSGNYYVFAIPIAEELDMKKAAKSVGFFSKAARIASRTRCLAEGGFSPIHWP